MKVLPPSRGSLDCVVMLFDSPADPRDYPWRVTWHAEHHDESTLALFATDFTNELVGPGIGLATYGGALFLFPPRPIADVWSDRRLDFADTLEERLIAAGCLHSQHRHIAMLSELPPDRVGGNSPAVSGRSCCMCRWGTSARKRFSNCGWCTS